MFAKKLLRIGLVLSISIGIIIFADIKDINIDFSRVNRLIYKPKIRAFLDTIAYAEGTSSDLGYRMLYGGSLFDSFNDHPRKVICRKFKATELCSSAAGRYQILAKQWDSLAPKIGAKDFSPDNQDKAAISFIKKKGAFDNVTRGEFEQAIKKLNSVWASFPGSKYGQHIVPMDELKKVYKNRLDFHSKLANK